MLKVENLVKYFGGVAAVHGASFSVPLGLITALIGPNGSGKSTIFNLVSRVIPDYFGKIIFDGVDVAKFSPDEISNAGISRLLQKSQLFDNLTVRENLLLALNNEDAKFWQNLLGFYRVDKKQENMVKAALTVIGMEKFANELGRELSYGQKRLVELERTILNPHKLLMLDEPVAGVTLKLREKIFNILQNLKKQGTTILLIEHDMNFALNLADKVIVLDEGRVIAEGTPEEIRKNKKVLEAYLG